MRQPACILLVAALSLACLFPLVPGTARAGEVNEMALGKSTPVQLEEEDDWESRLRLNMWTASLNGTIGAGGLSAPVDLGFDDIIKNLNFVFASTLTVRKDKWGFIIDATYLEIGAPNPSVPVPAFSIDGFTIEQFLSSALLSYRFIDNDKFFVEALGGMSYIWMKNELQLSPGPLPSPFGPTRTVGGSAGWADPVIGFRGNYEFTDKWYGLWIATVGGFGVSSELLWQAGVGVGHRFNDTIAMEFAYRYLSVDYDRKILFDADLNGLFLGFAITF